jgi:hypothetical protein
MTWTLLNARTASMGGPARGPLLPRAVDHPHFNKAGLPHRLAGPHSDLPHGVTSRPTSTFVAARARLACRRTGLAEDGSLSPAGCWLLPRRSPRTTGSPICPRVRLAKIRWRIVHDYRELKTALGLNHLEGRMDPPAPPRHPRLRGPRLHDPDPPKIACRGLTLYRRSKASNTYWPLERLLPHLPPAHHRTRTSPDPTEPLPEDGASRVDHCPYRAACARAAVWCAPWLWSAARISSRRATWETPGLSWPKEQMGAHLSTTSWTLARASSTLRVLRGRRRVRLGCGASQTAAPPDRPAACPSFGTTRPPGRAELGGVHTGEIDGIAV